MPAHPNPAVQAHRRAFGRAVRIRRVGLGLSQEKLAERVGWDRQSINRIENAQFSPSLDRVFLLAAALGVSACRLLIEANAEMVAPLKAAS